jgi:hypothetical protein
VPLCYYIKFKSNLQISKVKGRFKKAAFFMSGQFSVCGAIPRLLLFWHPLGPETIECMVKKKDLIAQTIKLFCNTLGLFVGDVSVGEIFNT